MKTITLLVAFFFSIGLFAQNLQGAWKLTEENGKKITDKEVMAIYQDGYFAIGAKQTADNKFLYAEGGAHAIKEGVYTQTFDFNTASPDTIGVEQQYAYSLAGNTLTLVSTGGSRVWQRVSEDKDSLTRNWVITGRERDGKMNTMTPGDRRTVKILSGGRFQWIAFNSATKEFSGSGGGTYLAANGLYTENITFFSRDDSRVGASLQFHFEVKDGKWHHKGKSSKGDPIYEIWSPYSEAYVRE